MILANPFKREADALTPAYLAACERVIRSGWYILGQEVREFEKELAAYTGTAEAIGCASGLDAILLSLAALGIGPGDEVITTPLSAVATTLAITHLGATPVFVDVEPETLAIGAKAVERAITSRTRAVLPVHLYGFPSEISEIQAVCKKHQLTLIEDCAQAIGARHKNQPVGTYGTLGCFSFYPTKNLGAFGDAGAIVTQDSELAKKLRQLRNYGQRGRYEHILAGFNSRLDELHAAVLRVKLQHLPEWTARRQKSAARYDRAMTEAKIWHLPHADSLKATGSESVYHLYPIQVPAQGQRSLPDGETEKLLAQFKENGVEALIHYPTLIPEQACYREKPFGALNAEKTWPVAFHASRNLLSLPINPFLTDEEIGTAAATALQILAKL